MLAQTWSDMYVRQHLERFMDVQHIHFLSLMAFFAFHIFGLWCISVCWLSRQLKDTQTIHTFPSSVLQPSDLIGLTEALDAELDVRQLGKSDTAADEMGEYERRWPLHDLDLQAPSLLASLTQLLATLFDCDLLVCFLKKKKKKESFLINNSRDARIFVEFLNQQQSFFH